MRPETWMPLQQELVANRLGGWASINVSAVKPRWNYGEGLEDEGE